MKLFIAIQALLLILMLFSNKKLQETISEIMLILAGVTFTILLLDRL